MKSISNHARQTVAALFKCQPHPSQRKETEASTTWRGHLARSLALASVLTLPAQAQLDTNSNGMSDVWERHFNNGQLFDPSNPSHHSGADPDGDGWSNFRESVAGMNPFDGNPPDGMVAISIHYLEDQEESPSAEFPEGRTIDLNIISWHALPGKSYTLESSPSLMANSWIAVGTPIIGDGQPAAMAVTLNDNEGEKPDKLFWRVKVEDAQIDTDQDGLTDYEEYLLGSNLYIADTSGDGVPDLWLVIHGYNPNAHHEGVMFGGSGVSVPAAFAMGVQGNPNATPQDIDGDGIPNELDAVLEDPEINWEKTVETRYMWIEQVEKAGAKAVSRHGHILFPGSNDMSSTIAESEILWDSATSSWVDMPAQGSWHNSGLVDVNDGGTEPFDLPWYLIGNMNDDGVVVGVSGGTSLGQTMNAQVPFRAIMKWEMAGAASELYAEPTYLMPSTEPASMHEPISEILHDSIASDIADDGTIISITWDYMLDEYKWVAKKVQRGNHSNMMPEWAYFDSNQNVSLAVILDDQIGLFVEQALVSSEQIIHFRNASGVESLQGLLPNNSEILDTAIARTPATANNSQGRVWFSVNQNGGDSVFIEKRDGGSGVSRLHNPLTMNEGAIRLNTRGEAITPTKVWRNGKYTEINELTSKPEAVTITKLIDLASNGTILAEAEDDGVAKTGLLVPIYIGLVEVDADGSLVGQPTPYVEPNLSAPVFDIDPPEIGSLAYDADGITANLSLTGQVRSDGCDAVRGEMGTVEQVRVGAPSIGGYSHDEIVLNTTINKVATRTQPGPFGYPFHGDFTLPSTPIAITEGTNVFEIEATDPVSGEIGKAIYAFEAQAILPETNLPALASGGITLTIQSSPDAQTAGTATLTIHLEGLAAAAWQLQEDVPGDGVFKSADDVVSIVLNTSTEEPTVAMFQHSGWGVEDFAIPIRGNDGNYTGGYSATSITVAPGVDPPPYSQMLLSAPELVGESGPGEARIYAIRVQGLEDLSDTQLEEVTAKWQGDSGLEFGLYRDPDSGALLIADPEDMNQPLTVLPRAAEVSQDADPGASSHTERLESLVGGSPAALQFSAGLVYGFGQGGYDLVTGLGTLWMGGVTVSGNELSQAFNYIELGFANLFGSANTKARVNLQIELAQKDLQVQRASMAAIATTCGEIVQWIQEANHDLLATLVLRPINAEAADFHGHRLGEKSQMVLDIASSLIESATDAWANAPPYDKGRYTGIVVFEVASSFVAVSKVGKLSKADVLADIAKRDIDIPGGAALKIRAAGFAEELATTKMCFVAGTLVLVQVNGVEAQLPIESLQPLARDGAKINAWAKCEHTGIEDWRPIVAFFTTHPEELFDLTIDTTGDGEANKTLTGTGGHPFWVEDAAAFIPMRELASGMRLTTARSTGTATVVGNISKRGPPNERFTTYNFEVAEYHTYFVGEAGVWVHNTGQGACERIFSIFTRLMKHHGDDLVKTYDDVIAKLPNMTMVTRSSFIDDLIKRYNFLGELKPPKAPTGGFGVNETVLIGAAEGLQSQKIDKFRGVMQGVHGDPDTTYLWTMDDRGINAAWEKTPYPTPRGNIVHSNLSDEAYIGGEVWFRGNKVTINAGSGRFGDGVPETQDYWEAAIRYWKHLGYEVESLPWGTR